MQSSHRSGCHTDTAVLISLLLSGQLLCTRIPPSAHRHGLLYSAARQLARKLAEEKQAAVEAARKAADSSLDEHEVQE